MPSWLWTARDRVTGEVLTNWSPRTPYLTKADFKDHVEAHFQQMAFIDADATEVPPNGVLRPVKPVYFTFGILDVEREAHRRSRPSGARTFAQLSARLPVVIMPRRPLIAPLIRSANKGA